jgi:ABC-type ATPase with predicted acetyltransferase domain
MIKKDHDEIWGWHLQIEKFKTTGMTGSKYCNTHGIDKKKFSNMSYRILYKKVNDPVLYKKLIEEAKRYLASGIRPSVFARENNLNPSVLSETVTHLGYLEIIENKRKEKENQPMTFHPVPASIQRIIPKTLIVEPEPEQEVVEKQNDIEIIITKGVKVSISPNIDSMKIIKIIECLKDL